MAKQEKLTMLPVSKLNLDVKNPRLPSHLVGKGEAEILAYALEDLVLEELALSLLSAGYFASEPMTVLKPKKSGGNYTVLEGNRRLATLRLLLGERVPSGMELDLSPPPEAEQLARLKEVPCHIVASKADVVALIGFRHIGGLKRWESEAKARFIHEHVTSLVKAGIESPFLELGRKIGSNTQGIRNPYIAFAILAWCLEELEEAARPRVLKLMRRSRFGVWQRALNSGEIRRYIGFETDTSHQGISDSISKINHKKIFQVVKDLTSEDASARPLVRDSRYVTDYGRILTNRAANAMLRRTGDIDLARSLVDQAELPVRIGKLTKQIKAMTDDVAERDEVPENTDEAANSLHKAAKHLKTTVASFSE